MIFTKINPPSCSNFVNKSDQRRVYYRVINHFKRKPLLAEATYLNYDWFNSLKLRKGDIFELFLREDMAERTCARQN